MLPFVVFAFYINEQIAERVTRHVVEQALMGLAKNLANELDSFVVECRQDVEQWADMPLTVEAVTESKWERGAARAAGTTPVATWDANVLAKWAREDTTPANFDRERLYWRASLTGEFDRYVTLKAEYDVLLVVGEDGRLVTCSAQHPGGALFSPEYVGSLFEYDYNDEAWFQDALTQDHIATVDHHVSPFRLLEVNDPSEPSWGYNLGFAAPIHDKNQPDKVIGVVYALVNWYYFQERVGNGVIQETFRGLVPKEKEPSPYAWIWASDADTILGHPKRSLYYQSIVNNVKLPQLTAAVRANADGWGLYPEYRFNGKTKNAAFKRCRPQELGGFGWVVGVGIDNDDIYATADELQSLLLGGTSLVLLMAVGWTLFIARRTTAPILQLQQYTRRVAEGDLDAQVDIPSDDELGALAEDLNRMTRKLKEQQDRLVKAEKDAAWREMARQIAHDIKNPLTPIRLSVDLLERARREQAPGFDTILTRTMELVRRQVVHLQEIAQNFYEFTGGHKLKLEIVDVSDVLDEVLHLHDAWAVELGVEVRRDGESARVMADVGKLRRVFVNLVSNALQAMPEGGTLFVSIERDRDRVRVSFRDTGQGLASEARAHLFEPYFTTKSEGTGLGLAISKQVIEQMGGAIELAPSTEDGGTVATISLPVFEDDADQAG